MILKGKGVGTMPTEDGKPTGYDDVFELPPVKTADLRSGETVLVKTKILKNDHNNSSIILQDGWFEYEQVVAILPDEVKKEPLWVEHIVKEGATYHVLSYDTNGVHCSEPNCEVNKPLKGEEIKEDLKHQVGNDLNEKVSGILNDVASEITKQTLDFKGMKNFVTTGKHDPELIFVLISIIDEVKRLSGIIDGLTVGGSK